ncbi:MAG: PorT family protein [Cyclobacteriaceae bacterium]|nr:PorT family protein [Cyclobacteriaceae bacterium]
MRISLLLLTLLAAGQFAAGQDCAQKLRLARATYEQGRLHEIPNQLEQCLASGFTKEEKQLKVEAYKILCLSYIYLEEPEKADQAMLNLKKADPYFEPNPQIDPAEFIALFNTFRKDPIYRIGLRVGGNFSRPHVIEQISAVNLAPDSKYKSSFALQLGAGVDVPFSKRLTLHGELLYVQHRFQVTQNVERATTTTDPLLNTFVGAETQNWISLPLGAEYNFLNLNSKIHQKIRPYVTGGVSVDYLLSATMTAERQRQDAASIPESSVELTREKINLSAYAGAGMKMRIASGVFVAEVRYLQGFTNLTSDESAFENQKLLWDYGYADPIFKLNSFSLSISYMQDIFKPKKLIRKK